MLTSLSVTYFTLHETIFNLRYDDVGDLATDIRAAAAAGFDYLEIWARSSAHFFGSNRQTI
jgi:hypothetical protein